MKPSLLFFIFFSSLTLAQVQVDVQDLNSHAIDSITPGRAVMRIEPKYPVAAAMQGAEGWVKLSFVIQQDGSVTDPQVVDSSGRSDFEREAKKALVQWKYSPAMMDGKPIVQCLNNVQLDFRMAGENVGASRKFKSAFNEVRDALKNNELAMASEKIVAMGENKSWNSYEDAWYWKLQAELAELEQDDRRLLEALNRATSSGYRQYLGLANYFELMYKKFAIEFETKKYADALETFEHISQTKDSAEVVSLLEQYIHFIHGVLASDKAITVTAEIPLEGSWRHRLSRHNFSLKMGEGELNNLELRCEYRREVYSMARQSQWTIPQDWGKCSVFIQGLANSSFVLLELAAPQI